MNSFLIQKIHDIILIRNRDIRTYSLGTILLLKRQEEKIIMKRKVLSILIALTLVLSMVTLMGGQTVKANPLSWGQTPEEVIDITKGKTFDTREGEIDSINLAASFDLLRQAKKIKITGTVTNGGEYAPYIVDMDCKIDLDKDGNDDIYVEYCEEEPSMQIKQLSTHSLGGKATIKLSDSVITNGTTGYDYQDSHGSYYKYITFVFSAVSKPAKPKGLKLKASKKKIKVSWTKQTKLTKGYQIQYSTNKKFRKAKKINITKNSVISKTIKKLKRKKYYYVRMRAYRKAGGKYYKSEWTSKKRIKTK